MTERPYWLPAGVALLGVVWIVQGLQLPLLAQYAELGPGFTVLVIGAMLVLLGAMLAFQIARGERFEPQEGEDVDVGESASWSALGLAVAGAGVPILTIEWLGFPFTAALSFLLVTRAFGSRRYLLNATLGVGLGLLCWYGFRALGVQLGGLLPIAGV